MTTNFLSLDERSRLAFCFHIHEERPADASKGELGGGEEFLVADFALAFMYEWPEGAQGGNKFCCRYRFCFYV